MFKKYDRSIWMVLMICIMLFAMTACAGKGASEQESETFVDITNIRVENESYGVIGRESTFFITLSGAVESSYLEQNLITEPTLDYELRKLSELEYELVPQAALEPGTMIALKHNNQSRVAGWAFQVSETFSVDSIYPADQSDKVPVNTGIEIMFNEPVDASIFEYIKIEPNVSFTGKVEMNTVTLLPDALEEDVRYEVSISDSYLNVNGNSFEKDFNSIFTTSGDQSIDIDIHFNMSLLRQSEPVVVPVSYYMDNELIDVELYKIPTADAYLESATSFNDLMVHYKYPQNKFDLEEMELLISGEMPIGQVAHMGFAVLPDLEDGYYLAVCKSKGNLFYNFFQLSPYSIYFESSETGTLIWGMDSRTSTPLKNANIISDSIGVGETDIDGTAYVEANAQYTPLRVQNSEVDIVLPLPPKNSWYYDYYNYRYDLSDVSGWLEFLYTDRPVYQDGDPIAFYGMLHQKNSDQPNRVILKLIDGYGNVLKEVEQDVTRYGTYSGKIENVTTLTEYNRLEVYVDGLLISSKSISITNYEKPEFTLDTILDKKVSGPGESVAINGNAQYFDETPARDMDLLIQYSYENSWYGDYKDVGEITTDPMGNFIYDFVPDIVYTTSVPKPVSVAVVNKGAEQQDVASFANVQVFPTNTILDCQLSVHEEIGKIQIEVKTNELNLPIEPVDPSNMSLYSGAPLDSEIHVEVVESYYQKIEEGYKYDPILKINEMQYSYVHHVETVEEFNAQTVEGSYVFDFDYEEDKTYQIVVRTHDESGTEINATRYFHGLNYYDEWSQPSPYFEETYETSVGEAFEIELNFPDSLQDPSSNQLSKTLFVLYNEQYQTHEVSTSHKFKGTMDTDMIPNAVLKAIFFDGENFHTGYEPPKTQLVMSSSDFHLELLVTTDKTSYKPGEEMVVKIMASEKGKPVEAEINLNIVDEAFYALYPESVDAYKSFYEKSSRTGVQYYYYTGYRRIDTMAEMGEGGGNGYYIRKDFKDTAVFTTVETNENGEATARITLPDNITTWRLTAHGIDESMNVGTVIEKRVSTLPYYVRYILNDAYMIGEEPVIMLRSGGSQFKDTEVTTYTVELQDSEGSLMAYETTGLGNQFTELRLTSLNEGQYEATIYGEHRGFKDAALTTFEIKKSFVVFDAEREVEMTLNFTPVAPEYGYHLRFWHKDASDLRKQMTEFAGLDHRRVEWLLAGSFVQDEQKAMKVDLLLPFIDTTGGLKPLVNSEPDIMVTLDAVNLSLTYFEPVQLKTYFTSIYNDANSYEWQKLYALWGLAKLDEPILYQLKKFKLNEPINEIILGSIYAEIGAYEEAYDYYKKFAPNDSSEELDLRNKFDMASLGALLRADDAEDWYSSATSELEKRHTWQLKQLRYLRQLNDVLEPLMLRYKINTVLFDLKLENAWPASQTVQKSDYMEIVQVDSGIMVEESYQGTLDNTKFEKVSGYSISRSVSNVTPKLAERIEVKVIVNKPAYESIKVIETVPSGFTLVEPKPFMNDKQIVFTDSGIETQVIFTYVIKPRQNGIYFLEPGILSINDRAFTATDQIQFVVD